MAPSGLSDKFSSFDDKSDGGYRYINGQHVAVLPIIFD